VDPLGFPERYDRLEEIGAGGMGKVYKAFDQYLGKYVALKVIRSELSILSTSTLRRFQKEAQLLGQLQHENLVPILDFNLTDKGSPYQVMDFVAGRSLDEVIAEGVSVEDSLNIIRQIAAAMAHAHEQGVIHRDLKPTNVIVVNTEAENLSVRVIDFGIAFCIAEELGDDSLTTTNAVIGSPLYMSPEQSRSSRTDERSDIYSLGVILFKCLTGAVPFQGASAIETIALKCGGNPPTLSEVVGKSHDVELENLVGRCLALDPADRFSSMVEVVEAIESIETFGQIEQIEQIELTDPVQNTLPAAPLPRRFGALTVVLMVLVLSAVAYLGPKLMPEQLFSVVSRDQSTQSKHTLQEKRAVEELLEQRELPSHKNTYKIRYRRIFKTPVQMIAQWNDRRELDFTSAIFREPEDLGLLAGSDYEQVCVSNSDFDDRCLEQILKMKKLDSLKASSTKITPEGIKAISRHQQFVRLQLDGMVDDVGLEHLAKLPRLSFLQIRNCPITDRGLKTLEQFRNLKSLQVSGCKNVSRSSLDALRRALPECKIVSNRM